MLNAAIALVLAISAAGATDGGVTTTDILVLDPEVRGGVSRDTADTLVDTLVHELRARTTLNVVTMADVRRVAAQYTRLIHAGCAHPDCAADLVDALHARELLIINTSLLGANMVVTATRMQARSPEVLASAVVELPARDTARMTDAVKRMAGELVVNPGPERGVARKVIAGQAQTAMNTVNTPTVPARRMAVLYFDQHGSSAELEPLRKGLADMLASDLSQVQGLRVLERENMHKVMAEMKLQAGGGFDPSTTQKVGRLLGAEYLVMGSFFDVLGQFRMEARVVRVETGEVVLAHGVGGKKEEFVELERRLVVALANGVGAVLPAAQQKALEEPSPVRTSDVVAYAGALDAYDRGDTRGAQAQASALLARVPAFGAAARFMARVGKLP